MNKWILLAIGLLAIATIYLVPFARVEPSGKNSQMVQTLSKVRQLSIALTAYSRDTQTERKEGPSFPGSLEDLVDDHYLTESDFERLTSDIRLLYFRPISHSPPLDQIVIIATLPDRLICGFASGDIKSFK
jgi:hypothetical protein